MSVALKEICTFAQNSKLTGKGDDFATKGVPFYTSSAGPQRYSGTPTHYGPAIIIGAVGSANVHYCKGPFATTKTCYVLTLDAEATGRFDLEFIYQYLHYNIHLLEAGFQGSNTKLLPRNYVAELPVPESSLVRQHKDVEIAQRLQTIIIKNEEYISKLDKLASALFYRDFGDPIQDRRFENRPLREIVNIEIGVNIPQDNLNDTESESSYDLLKLNAVSGSGHFDQTQCKAIEKWKPEWNRYLVRAGDLLMPHSNTPQLAGKAAYVFDIKGNKLFPSTVYRIKCDPDVISGIYLSYVFNAENYHRHLQSYLRGTVTSMSNIPKTDLLELEVPVPDMSLQRKFEQSILHINRLIAQKKSQSITLQRLHVALSRVLFQEVKYRNTQEELISLLQSSLASGVLSVEILQRADLQKKLLEMTRTASQSFEDEALYNEVRSVIFALLDKGTLMQTFNSREHKIDLHIA